MLPRLEDDLLLVGSDRRAKDDQILVPGQRKFGSEGHALTWGVLAGGPTTPALNGPAGPKSLAERHQDGGDPVFLTAFRRVVGCETRVRSAPLLRLRPTGALRLVRINAYLRCRCSLRRPGGTQKGGQAGERRRAGGKGRREKDERGSGLYKIRKNSKMWARN